MKQLVALAFGVLSLLSTTVQAAFTITQTSLSVNNGSTSVAYAGSSNPDALSAFQGAYLGRFDNTGSLTLSASSIRITVSGLSQACSGNLFYRVYASGSTPGSFTQVAFNAFTDISASSKRWAHNSINASLLSGINLAGVYLVEVYWTATGNQLLSTCTTTFTENNGGTFFTAYFEYGMVDSFTDGDFTTSPIWLGETTSFTTVATSDATASNANNSQTLRLNAANPGSYYMSTAINNWNQNMTWAFWVGRRSQAYNNSNSTTFWLYANESNLKSTTVDGYSLTIGDNSGVSELVLNAVTNNTASPILTSSGGIANGLTDWGLAIRITRSPAGVWTIFTSVLPTATNRGINANSNPITAATTNRGSVTNTTYTPSGTGFFGFLATCAGPVAARTAFEFDNLYFSSRPTYTCPANQILSMGSNCSAILPDYRSLLGLTDYCNCNGPLSVTQNPAPGTSYNTIGNTTVTISVSSEPGNTETCTFNVARVDNTPPVITCPANISVSATSGMCGAIVNYTEPSVTDNCGSCAPSTIPGYTLIGSYNGHTYFRSNTSTTWTAANTAANALGGHLLTISNATEQAYFQTLGQHWIGLTDEVVEGDWRWVTNEPVNYTNWNAGEPNNAGNEDYCIMNWSGTMWNDWTATATAPFIVEFDCINLTSGLYSGSVFPIGTTTVTHSAVDAAGNTSSCSFNVTVTDNSAPTFVCPGNITVSAPAGSCSAIVNYPTPVASDNCGLCSSASPIAGFTALGTFGGNAYYISNIAFTLANAIAASTAAGGYMATIASEAENNFIRLAATNAGVINYLIGLNDVQTEGTFVWPNGQQVTYTNWNAGEPNDWGGNEDFVEVYPNGKWNDINGTGRFILERECRTVVRTAGPASGSSFPIGNTIVTHTSTDANGNTGTCSFTVTVTGNTAPTISCPATQTLILDQAGNATLPDYRSLAGITDPCAVVSISNIQQTPPAGTVLNNPGTQSVSFVYNSPSGASANCSFNIQKIAATEVKLASSSGVYTEAIGGFSIPVSISNPSSSNATTVQLILSLGDALRVNNFSTQLITFPAGASGMQFVNISITNDSDCNEDASIQFQLTNVSGGNNAYIGNTSTYQASIADDDKIVTTTLADHFESGNVSGWFQGAFNAWEASNNSAINGQYSMRHIATGNGTSWITYNLDKQLLQGLTTIWRMNLNHYNLDPSAQNRFLVYLSSSEPTPLSGNTNGYAVGVYPQNDAEPDLVKLWRIENGVMTSTIATTTFDWNATHAKVGLEITRNEQGVWTIKIDDNGDFDNLQYSTSGTDNQFTLMQYFGLRYEFNSSTAGMFSMDDIQIIQKGCVCNWYSVQSGNSHSGIWSKTPNGTSQQANFSRYDHFTIQSGHNITATNNLACGNLQLMAGSLLDAGTKDLYLFGNLTINGTFVGGAGNVIFKGNANQNITTATNLSLENVVIDNDGATVNQNGPGNLIITKAITVDEGTFNSNDRLILSSTGTGTGAVGPIAVGADFIGKVTLQRHIPPVTNALNGSYAAFGCPLYGQTLADWNDNIITTGFPGSNYPPPYPFNNIYWYDESAAGPVGNGYVGATNITDALQTDKGYFVYLQTPAQMLDVTGTIQKHNFNSPLQYTNTGNPTADGWNLTVNRYPSEVDFRSMALAGSGVSSYSLFDSETNNYKAYNAFLNIGTAPRYIASSQAFFVKASAPGAFLKYEERFKSSAGVLFERDLNNDDDVAPHIVFQLTTNTGVKDQCVLALTENAGNNFDSGLDVLKINSSNAQAPEMALQSADNMLLTIDARNPNNNSVIPVNVEVHAAGTYTFRVENAINIPDNICVWVQDTFNGNAIVVQPGNSLNMTFAGAYSGNRLLIHYSAAPVVSAISADCANTGGGQISITAAESSVISLTNNTDNTSFSASGLLVANDLTGGLYSVIITYPNTPCAANNQSVVLTEPAAILATVISLEADLCNEHNNGLLEIQIQSQSPYNYTLSNSNGDVVESASSESETLLFTGLSADVYTLNILNACESVSINMDLHDEHAVVAQISEAESSSSIHGDLGHYLSVMQTSTNATEFFWSLDNGYSTTESSFGYEFDQEGTYTLMLIASNSYCSAADFIQVVVESALSVTSVEPEPYVNFLQLPDEVITTVHQTGGQKMRMAMYDLAGKLVWQKQLNAADGQSISIATNQLADGMYTFIVNNEQKTIFSKKFVK